MKPVKLALARHCIKYLIRAYGIKEIFVPYYLCRTVWKTVREENCKVKFYHIKSDFMPALDFPKDAYIIYPNYFGLCSKNCQYLANIYPNLIIDNTQSFYSKPMGLASFNSLRKFFPVNSGAYLYTQNVIDENFEVFDSQTPYVSPQQNYSDFVHNELILDNEKNIKLISPKIEQIMVNYNFDEDKDKRLYFYKKYYEKYNLLNKIHIYPTGDDIPYCYPFCPKSSDAKESILAKNLPLIRLWKDLPENFEENKFINDVVALPLNNYCELFV